MGRGSHKGHGGKSGKQDERLVRNEDLDARYNATPASTSTNATHFLFCLSLYIRELVSPNKEFLNTTECFIKFSKYLSWLLRFGKELLHPQSLSLTLHELFHFGQFTKHVNTCRTFIDQDPHNIFGDSHTVEVFNECKRCNINIDSMRWFIPFATVVWHNSKGRISFSVLNTDLVREPLATEWCTTDMTVNQILEKIRHNGANGGYKQNNIFFRAQSGHGGLREEQRPGVPYDFRHNILIHKTEAHRWKQMTRSTDRFLRCQGRDIHFVPIQVLLTDPDMLRQYGGRVLMYNMNVQRTVEAFRSARETPNGYILVSENIPLQAIEAVFDLDSNTWAVAYEPETRDRQRIIDEGIEESMHILNYYSAVVHRQEMILGDLPAAHKQVLRDIERHYREHLRYPAAVPPGATAGTTASIERASAARDEAIDTLVHEVFEKTKAEKQRIEAKAMPKDHPVPAAPTTGTPPTSHKGPPTVVLEQRAKEAAAKEKVKPPPKKLIEQLQQRPSADTPAKASQEPAKATTETPVRLMPKQPKHPPPPKRPADTTAQSASTTAKKVKQEEVPTPPAARRLSQNKIPSAPSTPTAIPPQPTRPAPSPPSRAGPMKPDDVPEPPRPPQHARSRTPAPPNPPRSRTPAPPDPPARAHQPKPPKHPPPPRARTDPYMEIPTPPAPTYSERRRSDTTDRREPLPRQRLVEEDEHDLPDFELRFNETADLSQYIETMNQISETAPDPAEERAIRNRVWRSIVELVDRGVSTGSRQLDRIIRSGIDSIDLTEDVYDIDYIPTPEEHFFRQDPGEQGKIFRPRLMISMTDEEFSIQKLIQLRDLGRNVLAGRAVCRDHVLNNSMEYHNVSTYYLAIVVLNLGNIMRQPRFANRKRFPSEIRNNPERLREHLVLPYLVVNNPGHIITLCESFDFSLFHNLCVEYNIIGVQCMSTKRQHASPPISIFLKSTQGMVEVLHHFDVSKDTGSQSDGWLLHGVIARCVFGPQSHKIDEYTRERTERRYTGEDVSTFAFFDESRYSTHGLKNVRTNPDQLDNIEASYDDVVDESYFTTSGFTDQYVQRLGLGEIRVLCLHINSYAFRHSLNTIRRYLRLIFSKALFEQVDFITGDFNLFLNRQFSTDTGGSIYGGLVVEVLEDAVRALNQHFLHKVTFNVSSSTPAAEVYDFLEHGNVNANMDCMACISLFYNKQQFKQERPAPLIENRRFAHDYMHNIAERPRQLSNYDLCLGQTDGDWHRPLIVRVHAFHYKNKRTRSSTSQWNRQEAAWRRQERIEHGRGSYGRHTGWYEQRNEDTGPYARSSGSGYPGWYGGEY